MDLFTAAFVGTAGCAGSGRAGRRRIPDPHPQVAPGASSGKGLAICGRGSKSSHLHPFIYSNELGCAEGCGFLDTSKKEITVTYYTTRCPSGLVSGPDCPCILSNQFVVF